MNQVTIRKATVSDFSQIQKLAHELYLHDKKYYPYFNVDFPFEKEGISYLKNRITGSAGICLVAIVDTILIGYLTASQSTPLPWAPIKKVQIENIYIREKRRRQYVGTKLIEKLLQLGHTRKIVQYTVTTFATNAISRKFYKKLGFDELVITFKKESI